MLLFKAGLSQFRMATQQPDTADQSIESDRIQSRVIDVWPNPSTSYLHVRTPETISWYRVIDVHGQTVLESDDTALKNLTIDVSGVAKGVYFLMVNTSKGKFGRKIQKM